jgi:hypothetical protein
MIHGPSLRAGGHSFEVGKLAAKLRDKASEVYKRARTQKSLWPSLTEADIESPLTYLNTSVE